MHTKSSSNKDLYYTTDHDWIAFRGSVAYMGICAFKLTGFRQIDNIVFHEPAGFHKQGDIIATIIYNDYQVECRMPVDGKIIALNENLGARNKDLLLREPESGGWLAQLIPASPYERNGLLLPEEYRMNGKSKYAKQ